VYTGIDSVADDVNHCVNNIFEYTNADGIKKIFHMGSIGKETDFTVGPTSFPCNEMNWRSYGNYGDFSLLINGPNRYSYGASTWTAVFNHSLESFTEVKVSYGDSITNIVFTVLHNGVYYMGRENRIYIYNPATNIATDMGAATGGTFNTSNVVQAVSFNGKILIFGRSLYELDIDTRTYTNIYTGLNTQRNS
jgi:hypothetical protein